MPDLSTRRKAIVLLSGNHLCHNPRALKEADALSAAGYDVELLGGWFDAQRAERDRALLQNRTWRFVPVVDWARSSIGARIQRQIQRAKSRIGRELHRCLNLENRWQLGYSTGKLLRAALSRNADLYIAHSEPAMWVAMRLLKRGRRVGVDMEDWFSEDLLPEARRQRPVKLLRALEAKLFRGGAYKACTSHAMAEALALAYDCEPPTVIYNAFPWSNRAKLDGQIKDRRDRSLPSVHWFSQTIGPGRGLEDLFATLPHLTTPAEIHLRGEATESTRDWINANVPYDWRERVFVHPLAHNDELLSRIAEHDIGFAGEQKYCRSRDLTVTNKILQYLLAGLTVLASNTKGQREIADQVPGAVLLYASGNSDELAKKLNMLLANREQLAKAKVAALHVAKNVFCWEQEAPKLINRIEAALK
jgi:glycosyltransferase involved in cell wall biosynthesis